MGDLNSIPSQTFKKNNKKIIYFSKKYFLFGPNTLMGYVPILCIAIGKKKHHLQRKKRFHYM